MRCRPAVMVGVCVLSLWAFSPGRGEEASKKDEKLQGELLDRGEQDQKARQQLIDHSWPAPTARMADKVIRGASMPVLVHRSPTK